MQQLADDLILTLNRIAEYALFPPARLGKMIEQGREPFPIFRWGGQLAARKSTIDATAVRLEAEAAKVREAA